MVPKHISDLLTAYKPFRTLRSDTGLLSVFVCVVGYVYAGIFMCIKMCIHVLFYFDLSVVVKRTAITLYEMCYANTLDLRSINAMLKTKLVNINALDLTMTFSTDLIKNFLKKKVLHHTR